MQKENNPIKKGSFIKLPFLKLWIMNLVNDELWMMSDEWRNKLPYGSLENIYFSETLRVSSSDSSPLNGLS